MRQGQRIGVALAEGVWLSDGMPTKKVDPSLVWVLLLVNPVVVHGVAVQGAFCPSSP